jgi:hypothetical protein
VISALILLVSCVLLITLSVKIKWARESQSGQIISSYLFFIIAGLFLSFYDFHVSLPGLLGFSSVLVIILTLASFVFISPRLSGWTFWTIALLQGLFNLFHFQLYGEPLSLNAFVAIYESNLSEAMEFSSLLKQFDKDDVLITGRFISYAIVSLFALRLLSSSKGSRQQRFVSILSATVILTWYITSQFPEKVRLTTLTRTLIPDSLNLPGHASKP